MLTNQNSLKDKALKNLLHLIDAEDHQFNKAHFHKLTEIFFKYMPPEDVLSHTKEQLYGSILSLWEVASKRQEQTPNIKIYNPELDTHGWSSKHTIIEIVNDDMPFLVDSVKEELNKFNVGVLLIVHPVVGIKRDKSGHIIDITNRDTKGFHNESLMQIQVSCETDPEILSQLNLAIETVLLDVRNAVVDWQSMRDKVHAIIKNLDKKSPCGEKEVSETKAFLSWMLDNQFTLLGYRKYEFVPGTKKQERSLTINEKESLGILKDDKFSVFNGLRNFSSLPPDVKYFLEDNALLMVTKTNCRATIHRPVLMDGIFVKTFNEKGEVTGEDLIIGLFTSSAYSKSAQEIPYIRQKLEHVIERSRYNKSSHNGKALTHILETIPRDELFQISPDDLYEISTGILNLQERLKTTLFVRKDPFERFFSCLLYIPKERYDTVFRKKAEKILSLAFGGECQNFRVRLEENILAQVHFVIKTTPGRIPEFNLILVEEELIEAARSWSDKLRSTLIETKGEKEGLSLFHKYGDGFSASYEDLFDPENAVLDIFGIEENLKSPRITVGLYRPLESDLNDFSFKVYKQGDAVILSDILPMIEHMGLTVITERTFKVRLSPSEDVVWIHDFQTRTRDCSKINLAKIRPVFQKNFAQVWHKELEDDSLNELTIKAALDGQKIMLMRAFCKYLKQTRYRLSYAFVTETVSSYPEITILFVKLFNLLHDPRLTDSKKEVTEVRSMIQSELDKVENLDQDKTFRRLLNIIDSTLRTNIFQYLLDKKDVPYVVLKLDSQNIDGLPLPKPWREIFVYNSRMEAVHLRGGKVARGGIRWSDRHEDFRTEVLGLVKAQNVKNTVIVPVGSKGGFIVKHLPPASEGREKMMDEVIKCYQTFMQGMLDITDNLKDNIVVPPKNVKRLEEDDPYLVVAADKGTATFSDIANQLSVDHGYWLGDAFASGGSAGYDHKKMGITAKGAWESVKRHFREMDHDIQSKAFTCVGVGDMSGDVFGNGMLLSKHTKLVGAFNHLHIFCDPNPDVKKSHEERRRLFGLERSTWDDYNKKLISKGGGVFSRSSKEIQLTPEIKKLYGLSKDKIPPFELIQAMLKAEVDLLWFGGIGTYIKSSKESNEQVGDKHNDLLRVSGVEVKAKVIGEGANLGMTQPARVEYAIAGGRINTDAIDNSAGVDTSDHEVNIKILLGQIVANGDMTMKQRDELLVRMTDEVSDLVLQDNYDQTFTLTLVERMGARLLEKQIYFMLELEKEGHLNRAVEFLPDDEELNRRVASKIGLTRPELSVILAYGKIRLFETVKKTKSPDDPYFNKYLIDYFPSDIRKKYEKNILEHSLRREIISTILTNLAVNYLGPAYLWELRNRTGASYEQLIGAFIVTYEAFNLQQFYKDISVLDNKIPAQAQIDMFTVIQEFLQQGLQWYLNHGDEEVNIQKQVKLLSSIVGVLKKSYEKVVPNSVIKSRDDKIKRLSKYDVPQKLLNDVSELFILEAAFDLSKIVNNGTCSVDQVASIYFEVGKQLEFSWLRSMCHSLAADNHWQQQAALSLYSDITRLHIKVVSNITGTVCHTESALSVIKDWLNQRSQSFTRLNTLIEEVKTHPMVDLSMLMVITHQITSLVDH